MLDSFFLIDFKVFFIIINISINTGWIRIRMDPELPGFGKENSKLDPE